MYGYFLLIKGIEKLSKNEYELLIELLDSVLLNPHIEKKEDILVCIDTQKTDMIWSEFIQNTNSEFYSDLRLYESNMFHTHQALSREFTKVIQKDVFKKTYNNNKTLFYDEFYEHITEDLRKDILKSLYNDQEFLRSIKIYLEVQNKSKAAKLANIHRNTLENRLDKFKRVTGFDVRHFEDASFVYLFLRDR